MNANKMLWEKGDFTQIAETMRKSGETLVETLGISKGLRVLDLACGDGNTAIPEAQLGAIVTGIDIAGNLVAAGNRRIRESGLSNISINEGDASSLAGLEDDSFDLLVSIFGAMFAPNPLNVAKEMVRVTKPGGRIIMGNWIPGDPTLVAQILKICTAYTPPPPEGFISPMSWGIEANVIERFAAAGIPEKNISFSKEAWTFIANYSPEDFVLRFKHYYGPTMNAYEAAEKNGRAKELNDELEQLFSSQNKSGSASRTVITANYLKVTVLV